MGTPPPDYDTILEGLRSMRFTYYVLFFIPCTIIPTVECVFSTPFVRKYLVKITPRDYFNVIVENGRAVATTDTYGRAGRSADPCIYKSEFKCTFPCAPTISPTSMQWMYLQDVIQCYL